MRGVASASVAMRVGHNLVVPLDMVANPAGSWVSIRSVISGDGVPTGIAGVDRLAGSPGAEVIDP